MPNNRTFALLVTVIAAAAAAVLVGGSMAVASYSGISSKGQILACWHNSQSQNLRLVDHFPCRPGETPVSWNKAGVRGQTGAVGAAGAAGAAGQQGAVGGAGQDGDRGPAGLDAYQLAVQAGYPGTLTQWLASLQGSPGSAAALPRQSCPEGQYVSGTGSTGLTCSAVPAATGGGLKVYDGDTLLGPLTSAANDAFGRGLEIYYLADNGTITRANTPTAVNVFYYTTSDCTGTAYVGQHLANRTLSTDATFAQPSGTLTSGAATAQPIRNLSYLGACSEVDGHRPGDPLSVAAVAVAAAAPITIR